MNDPIHVWKHRSAAGKIIGELRRFVKDGKKSDIPCYLPDGKNNFNPGIPPGLKPYPLFGLESVIDLKKPIYVVEGQKCQRALATLGLQSVTSILGARSADSSNWKPLAVATRIFLLPDNDAAGDAYMRSVYFILRGLQKGKKVIKIKLFQVGGHNDANEES